MLKTEGKNWIAGFRNKWIALYFAQIFVLSIALAFISITIIAVFVFFSFQIWHLILAFILVFALFMVFKPTWKIGKTDVAKYLNSKFIQLEESAELFLKPKAELSLLEQFQAEKIEERFPIEKSLNEAWKKLLFCLAFLVITLIGVYLMEKYYWYEQISEVRFPLSNEKNSTKEVILPEIENFQLLITPPDYTSKTVRSQHQFTIKAEAGAQVSWNIEMNIRVKKLRIIFNDKEIVAMVNAGGLNWKYSKAIVQSGFYQIEFDGKKSDLYQIEMIPDLPVSIKIIQPKPHTTIDIGQLPKVNLTVSLHDDYGIADTYISATMASGKGEGVSFTEKKLSFNEGFKNKKDVNLSKLLDLKLLGMKPGDELYFFVNAMDNHGQSSRSDVYLVSIVDTAELMSMAGIANGVDLVPEYFRSQRQIIIDTEKLLKEQSTLSVDEFKNRSNNLGMDQKLLRLRYGKFLGEESETEIGGDHDHEEGGKPAEQKFGDVQALMDEYAHKHDIAEDATFFEPEMKMQLKAVLNEMWSSELRLRTYKTQEALPFEYKALRLLKDLQQKSRAYVAKTTIKTTRLKQEKRLSGELDKITEPSQKATFEQLDKSTDDLKILLAILERRKDGYAFNYGDREFLKIGEGQLILAAASQPTSYLSALKSLRKVGTANKLVIKDIDVVQKAIQKLLGIESSQPQAERVNPATGLYRSYFNHLKKMGK
ncbi:hypothetical protein EZ428_23000 [Pedobacter frigiditerrae]|uniref:DUF4175 family protein n=1 Tax=Pedobacter frigiditerrae TaxID=2530452 RepID=A0A4R0MKC2_9SPHI|nr:hypothetical protein [Pedobacter frigiditerrae]TCC87068.1 hypothetical protein EZ428_23000 [Pedobacter frigiditerrae]